MIAEVHDDASGGHRGLRPRLTQALIDVVETSYGLSLQQGIDLGGSANLNIRVRHGDDAVVVRTYRSHVTDERLQAIQRARSLLRDGGVPCVAAVRATNGASFARVGDNLIEVEPFVDADANMDSVERVERALPLLARLHQHFASMKLDEAASSCEFANHVDADGIVEATRVGTDRIRSWNPSAEEAELADAADLLAEVAATANEPFAGLPRQLVHGDFWDNNVRFRGHSVVLVTDFDFMATRIRIDDLALTLYFTFARGDTLASAASWRAIRRLVDAYGRGTSKPLSSDERAALPIAIARQPLWSVAVWAAKLDDERSARRHLHGHLASVRAAAAIIAGLGHYQDLLAS